MRRTPFNVELRRMEEADREAKKENMEFGEERYKYMWHKEGGVEG